MTPVVQYILRCSIMRAVLLNGTGVSGRYIRGECNALLRRPSERRNAQLDPQRSGTWDQALGATETSKDSARAIEIVVH